MLPVIQKGQRVLSIHSVDLAHPLRERVSLVWMGTWHQKAAFYSFLIAMGEPQGRADKVTGKPQYLPGAWPTAWTWDPSALVWVRERPVSGWARVWGLSLLIFNCWIVEGFEDLGQSWVIRIRFTMRPMCIPHTSCCRMVSCFPP